MSCALFTTNNVVACSVCLSVSVCVCLRSLTFHVTTPHKRDNNISLFACVRSNVQRTWHIISTSKFTNTWARSIVLPATTFCFPCWKRYVQCSKFYNRGKSTYRHTCIHAPSDARTHGQQTPRILVKQRGGVRGDTAIISCEQWLLLHVLFIEHIKNRTTHREIDASTVSMLCMPKIGNDKYPHTHKHAYTSSDENAYDGGFPYLHYTSPL